MLFAVMVKNTRGIRKRLLDCKLRPERRTITRNIKNKRVDAVEGSCTPSLSVTNGLQT